MLIFSPRSRQLIDYAIANYGDIAGRRIWAEWVKDHPETRRAGEPWHDGKPELPHELVKAALRALDEMSRHKRDQREMQGLTEDQLADLDNDLSKIKSTAAFLTGLRTGRAGEAEKRYTAPSGHNLGAKS